MAKSGSTRRRSRWPLGIALTLCALVVVALAASAFAVWHFSDKAKPGVQLAGQDVTGQDGLQLASAVSGLVDDFSVTFTDPAGKSVTATAADLGVTFDNAATIQNAVSGGGADMVSTYNPFVAKNIPLVYQLDETAAQQFLDGQFISASLEPVDAAVSYNKKSEKFVAKAGTSGNQADLAQAKDAIAQAAAGKTSASFPMSTIVIPPAISDDAAKTAAAQANKALKLSLSYKTSAADYKVPANTIASWISFVPSEGKLAVQYDQEKIGKDLPAALTKTLTKPAVNANVLTDPKGTPVVRLNQGSNGTVIPDAESKKAVDKTVAALASTKKLSLTVKVDKQEFQTVKKVVPHNYKDADGAKWIDIDLTHQTATMYKGSTKVKKYVIASGKAPNYTHTGTWYVWLKMPVQTMRGPGYVAPNVRWISYFHNGEGFHAAPWVSNFGTPHSHGCINMRPAEAKELYDWAPLGTMVKVHY